MARKPHKYHYIYKTTCKVNGKYYIGMHSTSNLEDGYIGSGKRLWNSIRKYGKENHEFKIHEFFPDRSSLKDREREIVNEKMLQDPMCMNLQLGGGGGLINKEHGEKLSKSGLEAFKKFWSNPENIERQREIGRNFSRNPNYVEKICETKLERTGSRNGWLRRKHSQETIEKFRVSRKESSRGEKNSQYGTIWIFDPFKNKAEKILPSDLEKRIQEGCRRGRK